jgi:hypothetical protein
MLAYSLFKLNSFAARIRDRFAQADIEGKTIAGILDTELYAAPGKKQQEQQPKKHKRTSLTSLLSSGMRSSTESRSSSGHKQDVAEQRTFSQETGEPGTPARQRTFSGGADKRSAAGRRRSFNPDQFNNTPPRSRQDVLPHEPYHHANPVSPAQLRYDTGTRTERHLTGQLAILQERLRLQEATLRARGISQ